MKLRKNMFLCLIAILAIFSIVSCGGNILPDEGSEKYVTEDLSGWKMAWQDNKTSEDKQKIDIEVTGTVVTVTEDLVYLADGNDVVMPIYKINKNGHDTVKVGQKLTVAATELKNFHNFFEATRTKIIKQTEGTAIAPTVIESSAQLDKYKGVNYGNITFYGRVLYKNENAPTFTVRLLSKEDYDKLCTDDAFKTEPINPEDTSNSITIKSNAGSVKAGDVAKFTGHYQPFDDNWQANVFKIDNWKKMPRPFVTKTIAEWKAMIPSEVSKLPLEPSYRLTGIAAKKGSSEIILIDETTKETMSFYETEAKKVKPGEKVTIDARNIDFAFGKLSNPQVTDFEVVSHTATEGAPHNLAIKVNTTDKFNSMAMEGKKYYVEMEVEVTAGLDDKKIRIRPTFDSTIHDQSCFSYTDYEVGTKLTAYCVLSIHESETGEKSPSFIAIEVVK